MEGHHLDSSGWVRALADVHGCGFLSDGVATKRLKENAGRQPNANAWLLLEPESRAAQQRVEADEAEPGWSFAA
jgi:hypothetical protein